MKTTKHIFTETDHRVPDKGELYWAEVDLPSISHGGIETPKKILSYEKIEEDWKPHRFNDYWIVDSDGEVRKCTLTNMSDDSLDGRRINLGNCFPTKELAEEKLKQIKEILK